jgi:beta-glucosidase-like glycosyl hydrolase
MVRSGTVGSFLGVFGADYTRELQRIATQESRLKIPLLFGFDVIHGFRTIYPHPLAEAASFDSARAEISARQAAIEATAHGITWTFAPMVDIARDPRWGRISEGAGEDPYLGTVMAAARVRGFQGGDKGLGLGAPDAMLATIKHFAAYGGAEGGRDYNSVELSERTLWETYMPPYMAGIDAGAATVMASFNDLGGVPAHASDWLLRDVLRDRWGFQGLVISDWGGISELIPPGGAPNRGDAGILAIRAGVDIDMSDAVYATVSPRRSDGRVPLGLVDSAVKRVLASSSRLVFSTIPIDSATPRVSANTGAGSCVRFAGRARESIVLLKNANKTLPLRKALRSIAVIGPLADDLNQCSATGRLTASPPRQSRCWRGLLSAWRRSANHQRSRRPRRYGGHDRICSGSPRSRSCRGGGAGAGREAGHERRSVEPRVDRTAGITTRSGARRHSRGAFVGGRVEQAGRRGVDERPGVGDTGTGGRSAGNRRKLVPREPARASRLRCSFRRLQPGRQAPSDVPEGNGTNPDPLRSPRHRQAG